MTFSARDSSLLFWQQGVLPPPLHLFVFIHAQKVSPHLTSSPLASPFSGPAIWLPPPPCCLCLLSHPRLDHPLFSYRCLPYACPIQTFPVLQQMWWEMQSLWREIMGVGESLEQAKATPEVQAQAAPKTHLSQLPSIPSCQWSTPPTAYSSFPTWEETFKRAELWFRPHFAVPSEAGVLAECLSPKLVPPGLSKDLGARGGWGHLRVWLLLRVQKWEDVWRSVSPSEAVYFNLQWDFKSQAIH